MHAREGVAPEPLTVWMGIDNHPRNDLITLFPIKNQPNGKRMPKWNDLSSWMQLQMIVWAMNEWKFQTFNINIHPDLENQWLQESRDVRIMMRDRLRRELDKAVKPQLETFFVVEGWSTDRKAQTGLHIHGGAAIYEPGDGQKIVKAAGRAAGQGLKGYTRVSRSVHGQIYTTEGPAYINYLMKSVKRQDQRLPERRVYRSHSVTGAGKSFWDAITDQ
jgi:hypothetical protein